MNPAAPASPGADRPSRSTWAIRTAPRPVVAYFLFLDALAVTATIVALATASASSQGLVRCLLLFGLAVVFEEISRKTGQLRIMLSAYLKPDMTSVWTFPAAIVLPPAYAIALVCAVFYFMWLRHWRHTGGVLHRKIVGCAAVVLACMVAAGVDHLSGHFLHDTPSILIDGVAIMIALVAYAATNRALIVVIFLLESIPLSDLRGSWDDNALEFATLCLGGFVAVVALNEPALTPLVILPMVLLQRGAVVRQLEVAATTDAKTGLLNAIAWEQLAQRDLARAQRENKPLAVLIVDADKFKWVNDVHGHLVGDMVLKAIGEALTHELRGYDTVGRFGGEEFVACLPNADAEPALAIAERVRARINNIRISDLITLEDPETDREMAVSIGVACWPGDGVELTDLLHASDSALYVAKKSGRNRVALASPGSGGGRENAPSPEPTSV